MVTKSTCVGIGIQARSTSKRLPGKVHEMIGDKTIIKRIIESVINTSLYLNKNSSNIVIRVALLVPKGDPLVGIYQSEIPVLEGSEEDVLSRYATFCQQISADYVVRVTGDCPLLPSFVISKHVTIAVMNKYDYVSNADERFRTSPDGYDCEVLSKRMILHMNEIAKGPEREHVTTIARKTPPSWAHCGTVLNFLDLSILKLSVDTATDLEVVRRRQKITDRSYGLAVKAFGRKHVHRL